MSPETPEQRLAAWQRVKSQQKIADVQRRLDEPRPGHDGLTVLQRHGDAKVRRALKAYPDLTGDHTTDVAMGDQLETAILIGREFVTRWLAGLLTTNPRLAETVRAVLMHEDVFGFDPSAHYEGEPDPKTFDAIAHRAKQAYDREFGSSHLDPETHLVGHTAEPWPQMAAPGPDTRVYAILARWPFARTPILTQADLESFSAEARRHRMCDLGMRGGFCDGAIFSESTLIPIVREDVIIFVATCLNCLKRYEKKNPNVGRVDTISP